MQKLSLQRQIWKHSTKAETGFSQVCEGKKKEWDICAQMKKCGYNNGQFRLEIFWLQWHVQWNYDSHSSEQDLQLLHL